MAKKKTMLDSFTQWWFGDMSPKKSSKKKPSKKKPSKKKCCDNMK